MSASHRVGPTWSPLTRLSRWSGFKPLIAVGTLISSLALGGLLTKSAQAAFLYHGTLLVANRGGSPPSILRIDTATDTVLQTITQVDVSDPNNAITDVQVDPVTGNIFVAVDLNGGNDDPLLTNVGGTGEVVVFDPFGVYLRTVPFPNDGPGSTAAEAQHSPMGIDVDTDGSIWATLPASLQIVRVANNSLGTVLGQFDLSAAGARGPTDVHVSPTPGHVFVSDLDPNGDFAGQLFEVDYTAIPTIVTKRADGAALGPLPPAARTNGAAASKNPRAKAPRARNAGPPPRFQFPTMAGGFTSVEIEGGALVVSTDDGRVASFSPSGTGNGILLGSYNFGDGVASLDTVYDSNTDLTFVPRLFNGTIETPFGGPTYTANAFNPGGPLVFPAGVAIAADPQASLRYNLNTNIGSTYVGQSVTQTLTITNESANPVTVNDVFILSGSADFSVDSQPALPFVLQPGSSAFFTIRFTPAPGESGEKTAVLRVTSTDPVEPVVNFNIRGTVLNPTISTNPPAGGTLAFGDICLGSSKTLTIDVANVGDSPLTVSNIVANGPDVSVSAPSTPFDLAPGAHTLVNVTVSRTATGALPPASIVITSNSGGTSGNTTINVTANTPTGVLALLPASLDFGEVCLTEASTLDVDVYNLGSCDLTLVFVAQPGNAAYSVEAPPPGLLIQPGDHVAIPVTYTPVAVGNTSSSFIITTDDGSGMTNSSYAVTGAGAIATISASPSAVAFGDVCPGAPEHRSIQILNDGNCPATINSIAKVGGVNSGSISLSHPALPATLQPGSTLLIDVTVNAQVTSGAISTTVRTNINNSAVNSDVAVTAAVVPPAIMLSPTALSFGSVCAGMSQSRVLTIRNAGGCDLTVSNVVISSGGATYTIDPVTTPFVISRGSSASVSVYFAPNSVGNNQNGMLTVTSDSGGTAGTTSNVALTGNAPAGVLGVSPTALDFGSLCLGMSATRSLQIRNTGPCSLTVTSASLDGTNSADYTLSPDLILPFSIPAGSNLTTQVSVNPTISSSTHHATLTLTTSDANNVVVALTSNVSAAPTISVADVSGAQRGDGTTNNPYVVCVGANPAFMFTVIATDADAGNSVQLTQSGAPSGAGFTNVLPASGNPVQTTVNFIPSAGQGGQTYAVIFTATDDSAAACTATTTVHIRVSSLPVITATPNTLSVCEGMAIEYRVRATDADAGNVSIGVPTVSSPSGAPGLNLVSTPGLPHAGNPAEIQVTGTAPDVTSDTAYAITYTATDGDGCTSTQVVTVTVLASSPITLTMSRSPSGEIAVDEEVCFTAVVRDNCPEPRLIAGVPVCFTVLGSTGNNTPQAGVHVTTDANGAARYCFAPKFPGTVTVTAVIDLDGDCLADAGTQGATMNLTVAAPVQLGPGCFASGRGKVDASDPMFGTSPSVATFNFDVSPKRNNTYKGSLSFTVPAAGVGRRGNISIRSTRIESMLCGSGPAGLTAVIFGQAKVTGHPAVSGTVRFRVEALDAGTPGVPNDRFTIVLLTPSGDVLTGPVGGNLAFGRGGARPQDDIKIRRGTRVR